MEATLLLTHASGKIIGKPGIIASVGTTDYVDVVAALPAQMIHRTKLQRLLLAINGLRPCLSEKFLQNERAVSIAPFDFAQGGSTQQTARTSTPLSAKKYYLWKHIWFPTIHINVSPISATIIPC